MLFGSKVYAIVTYLLSENSDHGTSDCCKSAVVTINVVLPCLEKERPTNSAVKCEH